MRPRLPIRRILFLRPFRPPNSPRPFTQNTLISRSRPQLPFLSSPNRRPIARFLTTDRKKWIKDEVWRAGRWTGYLWATSLLLLMIAFGAQQEWLERKFPTPPMWSWVTRKDFRSARWDEDHDDESVNSPLIDWARTGASYRRLLARLEDPNIDGAGLQEQSEGGILVAGVGKTGFDISAKPEPWRRGYYQVLMGCARAAEHLDGWVRDMTRNVAFPANVVIGPSNPDPRPVPPGAVSAPREDDCEAAFETPDVYYLRILTTHGFTEKQRVDAALAYGAWLEYKKTPGAALEMYKWGLDIATSSWDGKPIVSKDGIIDTSAGTPSANILAAATALAVHHASNSNLQAALPIFLSVLRARKQLPDQPATMHSTLASSDENVSWMKTLSDLLGSAIAPPPYPSPPTDGTSPPVRDPNERCEEAGVMVYIGEILFASKFSRIGREDGLAWTREAVDLAEEELRRISGKRTNSSKKNPTSDKEARNTCTQCLDVGLGNWEIMVAKMAREERESGSTVNRGGWLGFGGKEEPVIGRWESEEAVVKERIRRAGDILGRSAPVAREVGLSSVLTV